MGVHRKKNYFSKLFTLVYYTSKLYYSNQWQYTGNYNKNKIISTRRNFPLKHHHDNAIFFVYVEATVK